MKIEKTVIIKGKYNNSVHNMIKLSQKDKNDFTNQMVKYSENFLKENFNVNLTIPIEIDGRLTRTGGSFHHTRQNKPIKIKVSERFIACALKDESEGVGAILDVLNHELTHYALCILGRDFDDGSEDFEKTLAKLNIGSSGATSDKKRLSKKQNVWYSIHDIYQCPVTGKMYKNKHTQKEQNWIGKRKEYQIIKTYF